MNASRMRWHIRTQQPVAYDIIKALQLFDPDNRALLAFGRPADGRRFVILDADVAYHYGSKIRAWFEHHSINTHIVQVPGGEEHKTLANFQYLLRELDAFPIHRRDEPIIAIGGGVLTDVAGFVAATYRRGVPHIKIPTTLMGYVDAAIGVKNGINFNGIKNRVGSFEPPLAVFLDKSFLRSLPLRHLHNGICEILKLAVIGDAELFARLETDGVDSIKECFANAGGDAILDRAIDSMLAELTPNLFEARLARSVDFGHTFSYGLETQHGHDLLHGEAVLLDILASCLMAQRRGVLTAQACRRIFALTRQLGLRPSYAALDADSMWESLRDRIEHRNGRQRVPLPGDIGQCLFVDDITRQELQVAVSALRNHMAVDHELALER